jgi:hypothetical protein
VTSGARGWEAVLDRWQVAAVVADADSGSFTELLSATGWHRAYEDADGVVFTKEIPHE